ncbi:divergent polysaccharide deacetylase family protein [Acetobacter musti]|uniref:divergent polysaccharide deacetylase family protein n=1 Tax=Acetobacter musti TaxID=864732 RepID=UPI00156BA54C
MSRLPAASFWRRLPPSGRLFFKFWGGVSVVALLAAISLQELSALHRSAMPAARPHGVTAEKASGPGNASPESVPAAPEAPASVRQEAADTSSAAAPGMPLPPGVHAIPAPLPDLLEDAPGEPGHSLPKIGADGALPRRVYAATVPAVPPGNARVAILLDGFGLSEDLSRVALQSLPWTISFAIPAYAPARQTLMDGARQSGHEIFLSLPMEPSTAPLDDEGPRALGYDHTPTADKQNLDWALSRFSGYVGATNAFSGLDGDAYAQSPDFRMVSKELDARGLRYLNATPGTSWVGPVVGGNAAITLDTDADSSGVDGQLAHLVEMAKGSGQAIAVAGPMRPVLLQRLAEWSRGLGDKGVTLVPVSALCDNPAPAHIPSGSVHQDRPEAAAHEAGSVRSPLTSSPPAPVTVGEPAIGPSAVTATPLPAPVAPSGPAAPKPGR